MPFAGRLLAFAGAVQVGPADGGSDSVPEEARGVLRAGGLLAVLPAAGDRRHGRGRLEAGLLRLLESDPVPVVPLRLNRAAAGMQDLAADGAAGSTPPSRRGSRSRMTLAATAPLLPSQAAAPSFHERIGALLAG